ncbi:hypothetical protein TESG_07511 [Trichophyton tonsurans CBS 112818]|uniref:Uncharacterized protein n=1 Tax=Trichophyton tonsurans (strain CBS 112818) TaxID=647933 RepID=F2S9E1_TRIT1|nr:hypothetical protein TESG_07511 [Trichophyton tonsurans CBS 112818]
MPEQAGMAQHGTPMRERARARVIDYRAFEGRTMRAMTRGTEDEPQILDEDALRVSLFPGPPGAGMTARARRGRGEEEEGIKKVLLMTMVWEEKSGGMQDRHNKASD